ncbi:hypothetical protein Tco_1280187 [Tanacetum coccineum]
MYPALLGRQDLFDLRLRPNQFREDVRLVERNRGEPRRWKEPIVRFAFTFSESRRLIWIREDIVEALESGEDITITPSERYAYMALLPRHWGKICAATREDIEYDTKHEDPPVMPERF